MLAMTGARLALGFAVTPGWSEGPDPESIYLHNVPLDGFRARCFRITPE
jgi:hypothetical protein